MIDYYNTFSLRTRIIISVAAFALLFIHQYILYFQWYPITVLKHGTIIGILMYGIGFGGGYASPHYLGLPIRRPKEHVRIQANFTSIVVVLALICSISHDVIFPFLIDNNSTLPISFTPGCVGFFVGLASTTKTLWRIHRYNKSLESVIANAHKIDSHEAFQFIYFMNIRNSAQLNR